MKKINLYKIISFVLISLMILSALSACSSKDNIKSDQQYITEDEKWGRGYVAEGMLGAHGSIVDTYDGFLGYGYNMLTAAYYNHKDVNSAHPVVDMSALCTTQKVYVESDFVNYSDPKTYIASSTKEYAKDMSVKSSVSGDFPLAGSFDTNFGMQTTYQMTSNQRLATLQANLETRKDYILQNNATLLAQYVTDGFRSSLDEMSLSDVKQFVTKYGTHVLTNVTMGGRFDLNYLYTSKSIGSTIDIEASLKASYRYISGSIDTKYKEAKKEIEDNSKIQIVTYGGSVTVNPTSVENAMASYAVWATQVQDGKVTLVDASEVVPIWEIIAAMGADYTVKSDAIKALAHKASVTL